MVATGPGFIGYGAALLWTGEHKNASPLYSLRVVPGNVTVRRNNNQLISARIEGFHPSNVQIFAHYRSAKAWESVSMQAQPDLGEAANYQFVFTGLPENVDYYVKAGPLISPPYHVRVVDLPSIKKVHVTYQYPRWTGMHSVTQEQGGDLRAIEGTDAHIQIETDKPLTDGTLTLDENRTIPLSSAGPNRYTGTIHMKNDGSYHLSARDQGQPVRLSEDYFIATDKAEPPQVSIIRPSGDYRASPIEEVTIRVQATAQFGLRNLHLHYSVNAGPDHDISILKSQGIKNAEASQTVQLEDYKLVPGDLVSIYATAQDGHAEARTDMSFVQVDPFQREFSQSQQSPSGGGGGRGQSSQNDMSKRQKELIAATWKQRNDKSSTAKESDSAAQFLADAQHKLRDQVTALSSRMNRRELPEANDELTAFDRDMQQAASFMTPSANRLKERQWKEALSLEQRALQALLHAEATFRQIQVAFGQQAGDGAGSSSAKRNLDSLFDLELDTKKNQYETAQNTSSVDKQQKDIDDVLAKLDALAKRQDDMSKQQKNSQQTFQERWQQEMLRRETEQLQRDMEQLARNGQQKSSGEQNQQGTSASSSSGSQKQQNSSSNNPSASSQNSVRDQRIQQALSRLREAGEAMKRNSEPQQGSVAARRASDQLEQAKNLLGAHQQQPASGRLGSLSQEADRIRRKESAQSRRIDQLASPEGVDSNKRQQSMQQRVQERDRLVEDRQQLSNDLTKLQQKLRESARIMAPIQPEAAEKLRYAITGMEESDVNNHLQRSSDRLRRGINPNADGIESEITQELQKLSQQLHEAQRSARRGQPNDIMASTSDSRRATLDQLRKVRERLESFPGLKNQNARLKSEAEAKNTTGVRNLPQATTANGSQQPPTSDKESRSSQPNVSAQLLSAPSGQHGAGSGRSPNSSGANASGAAGERNTGIGTYASGLLGNAPSPTYGDAPTPEQVYRDQLQGLDRLGRMVHGDSDLSRQVSDLKRRVQQLDPQSFHGNRELLEQLNREILSSIDRIEIDLINEGSEAEARSGRSSVIPSGYQDSVADYYRRLSKSH
jgi:hypothetical protein